MSGRVVVLIDGMYLQEVQNALGLAGRLDYEKLTDKLVGDSKRYRTYVFDALPLPGSPRRDRKEGFLTKLDYLDRFQVEPGHLKIERYICSRCGSAIAVAKQKRVDVLISTRMLECSYDSKIDRIVLLAGDADFIPAVEVAKRRTAVVLAYGDTREATASEELKRTCDGRIKLNQDYLADCLR